MERIEQIQISQIRKITYKLPKSKCRIIIRDCYFIRRDVGIADKASIDNATDQRVPKSSRYKFERHHNKYCVRNKQHFMFNKSSV